MDSRGTGLKDSIAIPLSETDVPKKKLYKTRHILIWPGFALFWGCGVYKTHAALMCQDQFCPGVTLEKQDGGELPATDYGLKPCPSNQPVVAAQRPPVQTYRNPST